MKNKLPLIILPLLLVFLSLGLRAQSSLRSIDVVPQVGDTFYLGYNSNVLSSNFYDKHVSGSWNYSFFKIPYGVISIYKEPRQGKYHKSFPNADMVLLKGNNEEEYYQHIKDELFTLGSIEKSSISKTGVVIRKNDAPLLKISKEFKIGDEYSSNTKSIISLSKSELNETFSWLSAQVDSIKFVFDYNQKWTVEDWGTMVLPQGIKSVQQHVGVTDLQFESYVKYQNDENWTTYTFNPYLLYDDFKHEALMPLTKQINFYSEGFKGCLSTLKFSEDNIIEVSVQQKDIGRSQMIDIDTKEVLAYPNPSFGIINFDLLNYPKDYYTIEVYNVIGKKLFTKKMDRFDNVGLNVDLGALRKGTYLYSLFDSEGQKICTKRLGIITP